ncbi:MAG: tyrosine-type recombinase/integrase [Clostridia bacterium]|nr:tyrosine-type recombinase/integrase [Clostridia bacterium]
MSRPIFSSSFSSEMYHYLDDRVASGYKEHSFYCPLRKFDRFCCKEGITEPIFTTEDAAHWLVREVTESDTTHYRRINSIKQFLIYLSRKGFDVFVVRDIRYRPTDFQPHIYNDDECRRYFTAVDTYSSSKNKKNAIQYPVLFRILYCCGTRLNETLRIRKQDIDLDSGIIKLNETKNGCERYIVLGDDLIDLMKQFADKCFYLLAQDDYIFTNAIGKRIDGKTIYLAHRMFLEKAGIPYIGGGFGPRVHDWRHHMAVRSFKQMIDAGLDMYVALPILSTYLGHKTIFATERYVRLTMQVYPYIEAKFRESVDYIFGGTSNENN